MCVFNLANQSEWEAHLTLFELLPWQPVVFFHHGAYDRTDILLDSTQEISIVIYQIVMDIVYCPHLPTLHQRNS